MGLFCFVGQIVDVFALLPQGHTLIMMPPVLLVAYTMGVADKERTDFVLNAEIDHVAGGLMSLIADTPFSASTLLVFGFLQFLPPTGILGASGLLFRHF